MQLDTLLSYIIGFKKEHNGCSPKIQDMCDALGIASSSTASRWLDHLESKGRIKRYYNRTGRYIGIGVNGYEWRKDVNV